MPVLIEVQIEGDEELIKEFERIQKDLTGKRLEEAWETATSLLADRVRFYAPHFMGHLLASIEEEVIFQDEDITGVVYSDVSAGDGVFYAPVQERGADAYWPNLEALEEWAEARGTTAYLVARAIATRGLPARRFFGEALEEYSDIVFSLVGNSVGQIIERTY